METLLTNTKSLTKNSMSALAALIWFVRISVAFFFILVAYGKLSGAPAMVTLFELVNIGQWFRYVTGVLELLAAIFLLIPGLTGFGALLITGIMSGAVATHLFIIGGNYHLPLALLFTSFLELYISRKQIERRLVLVTRPRYLYYKK